MHINRFSTTISEMERLLRKSLSEATFDELRDRSFELIRVVEMLCEVCEKPLGKKENAFRRIRITRTEDFQNLLDRARVHDRAEVDVDKSKIYFFDHDFPGDIHSECIEKL
jgi:hypothetical protein